MSKLDNDNFHVDIYYANKTQIPRISGKPIYNLVISIITDDKEALDLTSAALGEWFRERGLKDRE